MALGALLFELLTEDASVAGLVSNRVYPLILPQSPTLPAVSYQQISQVDAVTGSLELRQARFQFSCWAASYAGASALADALENALRNHVDKPNNILFVRDENRLDDYEDETDSWRVIVDALIWFCE